MSQESSQFSARLQEWVNGDQQALGALVPSVYQELRRLAHYQLRAQRGGQTLQSTALVNEAFIRLMGSQPEDLRNRAHFVAVAARLMRQILVDYARRRNARKRDGGLRVEIEEAADVSAESDAQLLALDEALEALAQIDARQARIVDMKFFGGLTTAEVGTVLELSTATVERDWSVARLWLRRHMGGASI
jgi:RNA polymerase sigma factor (TIGR02999 family)